MERLSAGRYPIRPSISHPSALIRVGWQRFRPHNAGHAVPASARFEKDSCLRIDCSRRNGPLGDHHGVPSASEPNSKGLVSIVPRGLSSVFAVEAYPDRHWPGLPFFPCLAQWREAGCSQPPEITFSALLFPDVISGGMDCLRLSV